MVPPARTFHPTTTERAEVTALAYTTDTREIARVLEDREAERTGKLSTARAALARRAGCAPGTLENLRKGRLKRIERWLHDKLEGLLVREIEAEIRRLTLELEAHRRTGGDASGSPQMAKLASTIADAQRLIGGGV